MNGPATVAAVVALDALVLLIALSLGTWLPMLTATVLSVAFGVREARAGWRRWRVIRRRARTGWA